MTDYNVGWLVSALASDQADLVGAMPSSEQSVLVFIKTKADLKYKGWTNALDFYRFYTFFCADYGYAATSYATFFRVVVQYLGVPLKRHKDAHFFRAGLKFRQWELEQAEDAPRVDMDEARKIFSFLEELRDERAGRDIGE
jgi:hypothetical protein